MTAVKICQQNAEEIHVWLSMNSVEDAFRASLCEGQDARADGRELVAVLLQRPVHLLDQLLEGNRVLA